ncbi:MAG TPA: UDP-glucose 4-epimerase GalE [Blastocatellia bacterium]|nr:UDP-glucose 4-epimerase GalE [Blastocatellia bacterium]
MSVLVTGGAGYIGSVMVELLREKEEQVVVVDSLHRGHREAVDPSVPFYQGCVGDRALITQICREHRVEACIHFAALAYVGESVTDPKLYFDNNVERGIGLLDALLTCGVRRFVFSSTCATYGEPIQVPIDEQHPQQPTNPYGWTKLFLEKILTAYDAAYELRSVILRYFNAAGAIRNRGEDHTPETHLLPNVLGVARGRLERVSVFGNDYPTPDGTAIRDYVHVADLASAHLRALGYLRQGGQSERINLGNGHGYSVMEVIETARRITKHQIEATFEPRRPGDPSRLIANSEKARSVLGWQPQYPELETIIRTAWEWHQTHPNGYSN